MYTKQIFDYIEQNKDNMVSDIAELIAIPSVRGEEKPGAPFGENPAKALKKALEICQSHGFAVKNIENAIGYADMNDKELELGILAHMDVVPVSDGWVTDPFTMAEKDGIIYGRGVADDKGPAVAALYAMKAIKELNIPLKKNVRLILGSDEECGSGDLPYYFNNEKTPKYSFSPDAEFPVINTEKGRFAPFFTSEVSLEGAMPRVCGFNSGSVINAVPDEAVIVVSGLTAEDIRSVAEKISEKISATFIIEDGEKIKITVKGRAAHASIPHTGINALTAGLELIKALPLADCKSTRLFKALAELFPHGDTEGNALGIAREDEISGKLTASLDIMSFDGTLFKGAADLRLPLACTKENTVDVIEAALKQVGLELRVNRMSKPHHVPSELPFIKTLLRSFETVTGQKGECVAMGGGTYVHDIENGVAFGPVMLESVTNMHGANEQIKVDELLTAAKIYALAIADICG